VYLRPLYPARLEFDRFAGNNPLGPSGVVDLAAKWLTAARPVFTVQLSACPFNYGTRLRVDRKVGDSTHSALSR